MADPSGAPLRTGALGIFGDPGGSVKGFLSHPTGNLMFVLCGLDLDGVLWRARTGSAPRFCSPGCRQAAYRRRLVEKRVRAMPSRAHAKSMSHHGHPRAPARSRKHEHEMTAS